MANYLITTKTGECTFVGSYDEIEKMEKFVQDALLNQKWMSWKEYVDGCINPYLPDDKKIDTDPVKVIGWCKNVASDEQIVFDNNFPIKFVIIP